MLVGVSTRRTPLEAVPGSMLERTDGGSADAEVDVEVVRDCVSRSVAAITYGGIAKVFQENARCRNDSPAICDNCCASETGNPHCECQECMEHVTTRLGTVAAAFIDVTERTTDGYCTVTTEDFIEGTWVRPPARAWHRLLRVTRHRLEVSMGILSR